MKKFWNWLKWIFRGFLTPARPKRKRIRAISGTIGGSPLVDLSPIPAHDMHAVDFGYLPAWPVCVRCGLDIVSVDHECPTLPWSGDIAGDVNKIIGAKMQIQSICPHDHITRGTRLSWCNDCGLINPPMPKLQEGSK